MRGSAGFGRAAHWASSEAFSIGAAKTGEAMTSRSRRKRIRRFGRTRHERHPCGSEHGEGMEPISHGFAAPGSFPLAALSFTSCIRVLLHSVAWTWQAKSDFVARRGWRAIPGRRSNPPSGRLVGTTPSKITRPLGRVTKSPQSESSRIPAQGSGSHRHALAPKLHLGTSVEREKGEVIRLWADWSGPIGRDNALKIIPPLGGITKSPRGKSSPIPAEGSGSHGWRRRPSPLGHERETDSGCLGYGGPLGTSTRRVRRS